MSYANWGRVFTLRGLRGERMRKLAGSAPPGSQTGSTMRDVRPETDRAPADHARSYPHHPPVGRPATEQRAVTSLRPASDGPPAEERPPAAGGQPASQPSAGGAPVAGQPPAAGSSPAEIRPPVPSQPQPPQGGSLAPAPVAPATDLPPGESAQPSIAQPSSPPPAADVPPPADVPPSADVPSAASVPPPADEQPAAADEQPAADDQPPAVSEPPGDAAPGESTGDAEDDGTRVGTVVSAGRAASVPARRAEAGRPAEPASAPPSWPHVIATTVRLWFQRRKARRAGTRRRALVFGVAILVFAAGGLTFALVQGRGTAAKPRRTGPPALSPGAVAAAAGNRRAAATWVAAQVSHSVIVSCDPVMCTTLQQDGFPAGDLLSLTSAATDPLGSAVVVSTTALRNQFGRRLPDVYAPVVLATFGHGDARVDIRVEAPDGGRAYLVSQRADELARQQAGQQLLGNKDLHVSAAAGQEIAAGNLDSRVLITLATLAHEVHRVNVIAVGDSGPGASAGVPLRMVQISTLVSPGHPSANASYLKAVLAFLKAQQPPYLASVSVLNQGGASIVQVQFAAPSPLGLLGAQAAP
jgi:hypothetical protein